MRDSGSEQLANRLRPAARSRNLKAHPDNIIVADILSHGQGCKASDTPYSASENGRPGHVGHSALGEDPVPQGEPSVPTEILELIGQAEPDTRMNELVNQCGTSCPEQSDPTANGKKDPAPQGEGLLPKGNRAYHETLAPPQGNPSSQRQGKRIQLEPKSEAAKTRMQHPARWLSKGRNSSDRVPC